MRRASLSPGKRCCAGLWHDGSSSGNSVAVNLADSVQYFQRDREVKDANGAWFAQPYFVIDRKLATQMDYEPAKVLVNRLRNEFHESAWLEGVENRKRIDVPRDDQASPGEDTRKPVRATLDPGDESNPNARWYIVRPANTPDGPRWFLRIKNPRVPGEPTPVYGNTPLEALEHAQQLDFLQFAVEPYVPPAPAAPTQPQTNQPRRRPGSF